MPISGCEHPELHVMHQVLDASNSHYPAATGPVIILAALLSAASSSIFIQSISYLGLHLEQGPACAAHNLAAVNPAKHSNSRKGNTAQQASLQQRGAAGAISARQQTLQRGATSTRTRGCLREQMQKLIEQVGERPQLTVSSGSHTCRSR